MPRRLAGLCRQAGVGGARRPHSAWRGVRGSGVLGSVCKQLVKQLRILTALSTWESLSGFPGDSAQVSHALQMHK